MSYFDDLGNDYQTLSSAKRQVQKLADKAGASIDIWAETIERWVDERGKPRHHADKSLAIRIMPKRNGRRNPLPIGKLVTVNAKRLRNGRVEIYAA